MKNLHTEEFFEQVKILLKPFAALTTVVVNNK